MWGQSLVGVRWFAMPKHKPSETVILLVEDDLVVSYLVCLMLNKEK